MIDSVSEPEAAQDLRKTRRPRAANAPTLDRLPPHSIEAEQMLLGCQMLDPNVLIPQFIEGFKDGEAAYYDLRHQIIQRAMLDMFEQRKPIEMAALMEHLRQKQLLDQVGGVTYLSEVQDMPPSAANYSYYANLIREKHTLRRLIQTCSGVVGKVFDYEGDVEKLLSEVETEVLKIRTMPSGGTPKLNVILQEAVTYIEQRADDHEKIFGFSTGLKDLDIMTDGIHPGELIVIGAPTSCGKTALALQIILNNALQGTPSAFLSAEMQPVRLAVRALANEARVNVRRYTERDFAPTMDALARINKSPLYIDTVNGYSISQVRAKARRLKQQHGIKLIGVENIQLFTGKGDNREQEIADISRGLKAMALELDIGVLALSQLNDEGRLRESRAIGHDADSVWLIYNDGEWQPKIQPVKLKVEKCRDGETGDVYLNFIKENTRFELAAKIADEDVPQTGKRPHKKPHKD